MKDIIDRIDEAYGMTMNDDRSTVSISKGDWEVVKTQAQRAEALERQILAGLQALGIGCNSIDQCAAFEREVRGTINVLEEQRDNAEKHRNRAIRKVIAWCENPSHRRNRTLQQQCAMLDELRRQMIDDLEEPL